MSRDQMRHGRVGRNNRGVRDWTPELVSASPVAPHRYLWEGQDESYRDGNYDRFVAGIPYKAGEVVYVERNKQPVLARVLGSFSDRDWYIRRGDRIEKYRVQLATKSGTWSKVWVYVWPGHVQRGYKLAGLAPEMPDGEL
jgi:hypothetical protein